MHKLGALAKYRLLLTGTLITNKALDVFSQYKFLNPVIFGGSFYSFRNRYFELKDKNIVYWGDIDTHGFAMLSEVRSFLPQTRSMLMDEATLLRHRQLWTTEKKPFSGALKHLNEEEQRMFGNLQTGIYGENVRFEQEWIPFSLVLESVERFVVG